MLRIPKKRILPAGLLIAGALLLALVAVFATGARSASADHGPSAPPDCTYQYTDGPKEYWQCLEYVTGEPSCWVWDVSTVPTVHFVTQVIPGYCPGPTAPSLWLSDVCEPNDGFSGDGWMTLYAFNDALLKDVGDWVRAGDPLATVGTSGGQGRPALYFELRRDGQPQDPRPWLRR